MAGRGAATPGVRKSFVDGIPIAVVSLVVLVGGIAFVSPLQENRTSASNNLWASRTTSTGKMTIFALLSLSHPIFAFLMCNCLRWLHLISFFSFIFNDTILANTDGILNPSKLIINKRPFQNSSLLTNRFLVALFSSSSEAVGSIPSSDRCSLPE